LRLRDVGVEARAGQSRLVGRIERADGQSHELYFGFSGDLPGPLGAQADAFVPALLVPAMLAGEPLESDLPVSPLLLRQLGRVQAILAGWRPELRQVPVLIPAATGRVHSVDAAGCFFSAGVDSFYSALKSLRGLTPPHPVSHLVFMKGFDARLDAHTALGASEAHVRRIADRLGVAVLIGESNVRDHMRCLWPEAYQGAALGAAGLALSGVLGRVLIPSTLPYARMGRPWGSHPLLDECWSTESVTFLHDGSEATRADKIEMIAEWDRAALDELRVCLKMSGAPENCGRCPKCVRTITMLALVGQTELRSFPGGLPADYLEWIRRDAPPFWGDLRQMMGRPGAHHLPGLGAALQRLERRRQWRSTLRSLAELCGLLPMLVSSRRVARWMLPLNRREQSSSAS
jgi:hypothetical protein